MRNYSAKRWLTLRTGGLTMRNITIRTKVRSLLERLDKIDPEWYNAEVGGEYRKFGGNIYNTWGPNKPCLSRTGNYARCVVHHSCLSRTRSRHVNCVSSVAESGPSVMHETQDTGRMPSHGGTSVYILPPKFLYAGDVCQTCGRSQVLSLHELPDARPRLRRDGRATETPPRLLAARCLRLAQIP